MRQRTEVLPSQFLIPVTYYDSYYLDSIDRIFCYRCSDRMRSLLSAGMDTSRWSMDHQPYYALVILIIACGSIPKGYDEGGYSACVKLTSFKVGLNLLSSNWSNDPTGPANRQANITSFNVLGAAFGALFALDLNDRLGRLNAWRLAVLVWANYRQRFWLLLAMQTVAQWTGGNGITYYISEIFEYAGVADDSTLISSGAYGIVKLVFTMAFAWGLIDLLGRHTCALTGLSLQLAAHIYMGAYMGLQPGASNNKSASNAAIASAFVYAVRWSVGVCTIPYLYGTEIFPTRTRNVSYAMSMSLHWFFQFAVVRVTPNMFVSLDVWGAYLFWACICTAGLVILGFWMSETKGVPIEWMGGLFDSPWYLRWRAKARRVVEEYPSSSSAGSDRVIHSQKTDDVKGG